MNLLAGLRRFGSALKDRAATRGRADDAYVAAEMEHLLRAGRVPAACETLSDAAFERIGRAVLAAYTAQIPTGPALVTATGPAVPTRRRRFPAGMRAGSRGLPVLASVALLLGTVTGGALAESRPGHSLYPVRLAIEALTLPARGSRARIDAQLVRLDQRVHEAADATTESDGHAVDDAVSAYRDTLRDLADLAKVHPTLRHQVAERLRQTGAALSALAARAAPQLRAHVAVAVAETCATRSELWSSRPRPTATTSAVDRPQLPVLHRLVVVPAALRPPPHVTGRVATGLALAIRSAGHGTHTPSSVGTTDTSAATTGAALTATTTGSGPTGPDGCPA